jgi:YbbR domain-containing protein
VNISTQKIQATVKLENLMYKQVRLEPKIIGQLREDRMLGVISIEPEYILIEGPKSQVNPLEKIQTVDIDITNQKQTINKEVEINNQYQRNGIILQDTMVKVIIPIYKYRQEEFEIPVVLKNTNKKYKYSMGKNNIKVTMKAAENEVDVGKDFTAIVDVSPINYQKIGKAKTEILMPVKLLFKQNPNGLNESSGLNGNDSISFEPAKITVGVSRK